MRTLRYAVIGCGMMGHEHLKNLCLLRDKQSIDIQVTALIDPNDAMRQSSLTLAHSLGFDTAISYSTLAEVDLSCVDAWIIVSPNFTHHDIIVELLPSQRPILSEKPLCTTLEDCNDIVQRLSQYPAPFWVAMEYRYMPPTARFIERLQEGCIGKLQMLSIKEHRFPFLDKVDDWNRFSENTGGTLVEKCCHHFDLMRLMTGSEPVKIYASGGIAVNHLDEQYQGKTPDILDNALVIVDFENGVRASLELCMFADGADPQEQLCAIGDKGKLDAFIPGPDRFWPDAHDRQTKVVFSPRDKTPPQVDVIEVDQALADAGDHHGSTYYQHVRFAQAILQGNTVEVTENDGAIAVSMGAAAQASIRSGLPVDMRTFSS